MLCICTFSILKVIGERGYNQRVPKSGCYWREGVPSEDAQIWLLSGRGGTIRGCPNLAIIGERGYHQRVPKPGCYWGEGVQSEGAQIWLYWGDGVQSEGAHIWLLLGRGGTIRGCPNLAVIGERGYPNLAGTKSEIMHTHPKY